MLVKKVDFINIGRKGPGFMRRRSIPIRNEYIGLVSKTRGYEQAAEIGNEVIRLFTNTAEGEQPPDKIYLMYNEFKSALQQRVIINQILPLARLMRLLTAAKPDESQV